MSKLEENFDEHNVVGVEDVEDVELVDFGRGNYSDTEFVWQIPVGITSIKFFNSPDFGEQYQNDMFVGDINNGILYNFDLNENRTGLELGGERWQTKWQTATVTGVISFLAPGLVALQT